MRNVFHSEIVDKFTSAAIPMEKLDHPKMRESFTNMSGTLIFTNSLRSIWGQDKGKQK